MGYAEVPATSSRSARGCRCVPVIVAQIYLSAEAAETGCWSDVASEETMSFEEGDAYISW